jgi:hypothetical protein
MSFDAQEGDGFRFTQSILRAKRLWEMKDIVDMIEAWEASQ